MSQLSDYTESQQAALLHIQRDDPEFEAKWENHKQSDQYFRRASLKQLRPGRTVKLFGLKRKSWNGKKAKIIGRKVLKSEMIKWPVQLMDGSRSKALIKQCNLQKVDKNHKI